MQHNPRPENKAKMSPPGMSSTVLDIEAPFLPPEGINDTEITGASLIPPIQLGDSPIGGAPKRHVIVA